MKASNHPALAAPLITIVTATFNAAGQLPHTLDSLREQTYRNFEWIVVDGGSTDGTLALLGENEDLLAYWISEPDSGIYDAWNKACAHARGEWIIFLGAGDELAKPETLERCAPYIAGAGSDTVFVYGRLELLSEKNRVPLEICGVPWEDMRGNWEIGRPALPPHGACFHRRELFADPEPFDLRFPISADSFLMLHHVLREPAVLPAFIPFEVTRSPIGGVSFRLKTACRVQREIHAINRELGISPPFSHRLCEGARMLAIRFLLMLPERLAQQIADSLRRLAGKPRRWSVQ